MGTKNPQDGGAYYELAADDSSSSSSADDYEEVDWDEIDPDDSVSATAKQPPDHRTKHRASHQKSVPQQHHHQHRRQQPQSVPSSVYMESGAVGPQVYPYPYSGFPGPGPQGVAGWAFPPAPYYGNAGYMPPNQDRFAAPYWQRRPYEEGKEMMPYQMWNPFAPAQGAGPPPAAPVERKSRRFLKQSRKGKEKPLSVQGPSRTKDVLAKAQGNRETMRPSCDCLPMSTRFITLPTQETSASISRDLKSLLLLDGDSVFGRRGFPGRKDPEKSESKEPLEMNWMLVRAMALSHSQNELEKLRVFSLGMRLTCLAPDRTISRSLRERGLSGWADWKSIYRQLLAEQRIWDFRDVLIEACVSYDTDQALSAFLDHASPIEGMVADWQTGTPDESTELALLDLLSFIALNSGQSLDDGSLAEDCLRLAEPIGNSLLDRFPQAVHSRPFIQWLVSKAVVKNAPEQFAYLSDYAGLAICPKSAAGLPYYIPIRQENPGWVPRDLTPAARDVLEVTLKTSRDMQDYQTEALCLNQLALGTKDPRAYFQQLGQLQKKQNNMAGFLSTCLTRYLICRDDESKEALLDDLNSFGSWKEASDLIVPTEAAARDVLQHALSRGSARSPSPSIMSASRYSLHLPEPFKSIFRHLPRPRLADTGEELRPPTETLRVEQSSESEDEPQESPENNTTSRNVKIGASRVGDKDQSKSNHQPAAPGFYSGPLPYYGIPPHVAQYMYPAPPPPPTEAPGPPKTPAPREENPQMVQMKKQLELLQAERKQQEESKKQADMEKRIREDAERAFKIRMEEMQRAQEEAKKEIERAKIAAERAARERIEEERKAEAERQRQHAETMAKAERDAKEKYEAALKAKEDRGREHAEIMAQAERQTRERIKEEMKAEAEQKARVEKQRALMEAELRRELAAEVKAQEEARAAAEARAAEERARREAEDAELRAEAVRAYEDKIAAKREERERMEAERRAGEELKRGRTR
ncbi:hypothetical protein INS49_015459 [Diaporthe citri]|uniref:uncharacterized protein n=1 Tax=Diaporthe citri TaxID=83186 RepID=UPI001C823EAE|nr:uncharacterized protein INS49_015459 [Diaporthe citri]KAG6356074.1 hypothetical protein INS49_015459 [Diaporthe citri]